MTITKIKMEDLTYLSEPTNILAIGRNQRNKINFTVKSIDRYLSSQGAKMVKYVCYCESIYKKEQVFYVNYGLNADYKNIQLSYDLAPTTFK